MKKCLFTGIAFFAWSVVHATAADLPTIGRSPYYGAPPPVYVFQWTGCYVGLNGGYGWGKSELVHTPTGAWLGGDIPILVANGSPTLTYGGVEVGGQFGCNYQAGSFVAGVEADAAYLRMRGSSSFGAATGLLATGIYTQENRFSWLSTARGRVGGAFDRTLLYVTGGVAFAQIGVSQSIFFNASGSTAVGTADTTNVGWVAGVGAENALTNNWLLRVEYLYADLGRVTADLFNPNFPAFTHQVSTRARASIARVGISYKFGSPAYPTY